MVTRMPEQYHERVQFRVIKTPCCSHLLCWVNPRFPTYCPMCGVRIYPEVKREVLTFDDEAVLSWVA